MSSINPAESNLASKENEAVAISLEDVSHFYTRPREISAQVSIWQKLMSHRDQWSKEPKKILQHLSVTFEPGSITSIVGESGCGKTTLLRLIAGLSYPSAGVIHFSKPQTKIGVVFQEPRLLEWLTIYDNVALAIRHESKTDQHIKVETMLQRVGLKEAMHLYPRQISGGMAQRAAFARALIAQPDILLLDEPFSALDALTRARMQSDFIDWWQARPITVLLVTHDVMEAVRLSRHIFAMDKGQLARHWGIDTPYPRSLSPDLTKTTEQILQTFTVKSS